MPLVTGLLRNLFFWPGGQGDSAIITGSIALVKTLRFSVVLAHGGAHEISVIESEKLDAKLETVASGTPASEVST